MGRVYPVTELPAVNDPNSLLGKGCKPGFDSHYCVVKRAGNTYIPCPAPGMPNHTPPDYDEMVVFSKTQILPRYILHYHIVDTARKTDGQVPQTLVSEFNLLWVDDKPSGEHSSLLARWAQEKPAVFYGSFTSTEELRVWFTNRAPALFALGAEVRIITNRSRERDGGESAAENLVKYVRTDSPCRSAKVLIFCKNTDGLTHLDDANTYDKFAFTLRSLILHEPGTFRTASPSVSSSASSIASRRTSRRRSDRYEGQTQISRHNRSSMSSAFGFSFGVLRDLVDRE